MFRGKLIRLVQPIIHQTVRLVASTLALAVFAAAHDIPVDVTTQIFLKPEGQKLNVLVRVPLPAIRDVVFPERSQGYLDIARAEPLAADTSIQWIADFLAIYEGGERLPQKPRIAGARISLPSDRSFDSYDHAVAHIRGPSLPDDTTVVWNQVLLDVWFEYPIQSDHSRFSIDPGLAHLGQRVVTVLRFLPPGGDVRAFEFIGDPGLVHLDPRWGQAALRFITLGFQHILDGTDHLLFLFCLVIPLRRFRSLLAVVTAFTVAHSITLIASAYNLAPDVLWFPPLIEVLIALSIVYMALENIVGAAAAHRRWLIAFGFGLIHGFGFSFALRETLQFAGKHLLTSLLSFNVGVELGQLLILLVLVPALDLVFRYVVAERIGTIILSAIAAHTAWHWMLDRADRLRQYRFEWPVVTAAAVLRGLFAAALVAGLVWLLRMAFFRRRAERVEDSM